MARATFSGNSHYQIDVDAALVSQSGNVSKIYWRILVIKTNYFGNSAWGNTGSHGWADSSKAGGNDLWSNGNMQFNFQNGSNNGTFTMAEGTFFVTHNADGTGTYTVNGGLTLNALGSASAGTGKRTLPRIGGSSVPAAPTSLGVDTIEQTSVRYRFSGNSSGGSPILEWQVGYGTNPSSVQYSISSNGTSVIGALAPATTYYFWARGRNAAGWGPWSARTTGRTIAGARVRSGGVWKEAIPYVKVNGVWKVARPHVRVAGTWKKSV